eukprot:COSAG06_NODE_22701_length_715_cov_1.305195_1_plen_238_part_11
MRPSDGSTFLPIGAFDATEGECCEPVTGMCGGNFESHHDFNGCRPWTTLALDPQDVPSHPLDTPEQRRLACCRIEETNLVAAIVATLFLGCVSGSGLMHFLKVRKEAAVKAKARPGQGSTTVNPLLQTDDDGNDAPGAGTPTKNPMFDDGEPEAEPEADPDDWAAAALKKKQLHQQNRQSRGGAKEEPKKKLSKKEQKAADQAAAKEQQAAEQAAVQEQPKKKLSKKEQKAADQAAAK